MRALKGANLPAVRLNRSGILEGYAGYRQAMPTATSRLMAAAARSTLRPGALGDLRQRAIVRFLLSGSQVLQIARQLRDQQDFIDIEQPLLLAREFGLLS